MDRRKVEEGFFVALMRASSLLILSVLAMILWTVIRKGAPAMDLAMLTQIPKGGFYMGKEGGVLNAILGSIYLSAGAIALAASIALPVVLYINVYARRGSRVAAFTRFSFDVMWGVPSIVYGAFGFSLMLFLGLKASLLGGIVTVAIFVFPVMTRAMDESVKMVPDELSDAAYALGLTRFEVAWNIVLRQTVPAIVTAVMLSFGRAIGDAASVLFTAGFTDSLPTSLLRPVATLPLAIFFQLGTPFREVQERAYASALILTVIILFISLLIRVLSRGLSKNVAK